jgi:alkanesulfonate monooxygenase SsuD/methylene tetrahydromethanopterin reductase-like flavin-dependent oxidoreductase (luciferase family)
MVLAAAAQRAPRIRLGTAVTLLPLHNPVKIAEEAAIADILSNGRLELGVGRGTAPLHYEGYAIPMEESRERFEEALDFIIGAWSSESFSFDGKYFRARQLSRAQAREECEPGLLRFLREAAERLRPLGDHDIKSFEAFRQVLARIERVTYADMDREMGVFGDPDYCVERVRSLQREYGMDEFICYFNQGGIMDHAMVRQSMTLFAKEVMPHCR